MVHVARLVLATSQRQQGRPSTPTKSSPTPFSPGFRDLAPYPVIIVELDAQRGVPTPQDGLRLIANLVDDQFQPEAEANVAIGKRVDVVFQDLSPELSLPQFRLTDEPPAGVGVAVSGVRTGRPEP